jgi:hypothetical protein
MRFIRGLGRAQFQCLPAPGSASAGRPFAPTVSDRRLGSSLEINHFFIYFGRARPQKKHGPGPRAPCARGVHAPTAGAPPAYRSARPTSPPYPAPQLSASEPRAPSTRPTSVRPAAGLRRCVRRTSRLGRLFPPGQSALRPAKQDLCLRPPDCGSPALPHVEHLHSDCRLAVFNQIPIRHLVCPPLRHTADLSLPAPAALLTHSLTRPLTHSLTRPLTYSLPHSLSYPLTRFLARTAHRQGRQSLAGLCWHMGRDRPSWIGRWQRYPRSEDRCVGARVPVFAHKRRARDAIHEVRVDQQAGRACGPLPPCGRLPTPDLGSQGPGAPVRGPGRGSCAVGAPTRATQLVIPGCQRHCFSAVPWNMPSPTAPHLTYVLLTPVHSQTPQRPLLHWPCRAPVHPRPIKKKDTKNLCC